MADPLVIRRVNMFKDNLQAREAREMQEMSRRWRQVERKLRQDIEQLVERTRAEGITPAQIQSAEFRVTKLNALLAQVRSELNDYNTFAEQRIEQEQRHNIQAGIDCSTQTIKAVGAQAGVRLSFDVLPIRAVEFMVGFTRPMRPLSELLETAYNASAQGIITQLIQSTARGINPRESARLIIREGLAQGLNRILNIARTEQLRAFRESNRRALIHSGLVTSYLRSAARDSRTCIGCLAADGWEYELTEHFKSHPSCRCALVPRVAGLPAPTWEKGPVWFDKQPESVKKKMLGPTKYKAYQDKFNGDLSRFVKVTTNSTWGDGITTKTLSELGLEQVNKKIPDVPAIPAKPKPVAPVFKTTKEAEKWANENFNHVTRYGKMHPELANEINQCVLDTFEIIPQARQGMFSIIGSAQARNKYVMDYFEAQVRTQLERVYGGIYTKEQIEKQIQRQLKRYVKKIPGNVYAYAYPGGGQWEPFKGIALNDRWGTDPVGYRKSLVQGVKDNWHPVGTEATRSTIDHEIGHAIDFYFDLRNDVGMLDIIKQIKDMPGGISGNLSDYAKTNTQEVIAEAWGEYMNNPSPRKASRMIAEYMIKVSQEDWAKNGVNSKPKGKP